MNPLFFLLELKCVRKFAFAIATCWASLLVESARAAESLRPTTISITDIQSGAISVVGTLTVPLGTVVEIEARIVEEKPTSIINVVQRYLLEIVRVNGRALANKPLMSFSTTRLGNARVAATPANLDALVRDLTTPDGKDRVRSDTPISQEEAEKFRRGYVGSTHKLVVHECAWFGGTPANMPPEFGHLGTLQPFALRTEIDVLGSR